MSAVVLPALTAGDGFAVDRALLATTPSPVPTAATRGSLIPRPSIIIAFAHRCFVVGVFYRVIGIRLAFRGSFGGFRIIIFAGFSALTGFAVASTSPVRTSAAGARPWCLRLFLRGG
ncbi:hypothetical protein BI364_08440 [Acidihalobacter yilgarnensis]|uniref:Uncharacterized protein n=1 Tax=Acidihalobacter yilgarnensis TaxID=2819280 RepID=A0A1D8IND7_9GAMM|nr:hypothetical protein BI364_08440 [Acidihalobacter yilgarnensis]